MHKLTCRLTKLERMGSNGWRVGRSSDVCVCVCVFVCMYVNMCVCVYIYIHMLLCINQIYAHSCMCVYVCVCTYVSMHVSTDEYECLLFR
jgi:hypothetical protein